MDAMLHEITSEVLHDLSTAPGGEDTDPKLNDGRTELEKRIKSIVLNMVFDAIADADDKPDNGDTYTVSQKKLNCCNKKLCRHKVYIIHHSHHISLACLHWLQAHLTLIDHNMIYCNHHKSPTVIILLTHLMCRKV